MKATEVIEYFGGIPPVAKALGITYQAVWGWVEKDAVPEGRQWQLQGMTGGALTVSVENAA